MYFGMVPRIISEALHSQGYDVKYRFMHWSDALDGIITEEFDGAIIWVMEDLNHPAFLISDPIVHYRSALYYRKSLPRPTSSDDLLGFRMGLNSHYVYDQDSYELLKDNLILPIEGHSDLTNFQYLIEGRIDYFLTPLLTSKPLLRNNFPKEQQQQLDYSTSIFKFPPTHLIVNRYRDGSDEIMNQFNASLKRMENNGTIDRYIRDFRFSKY